MRKSLNPSISSLRPTVRHSPSISFFELAVYAADLDLDHLETFYSHVETNRRDPNEYDIVLGGALKH